MLKMLRQVHFGTYDAIADIFAFSFCFFDCFNDESNFDKIRPDADDKIYLQNRNFDTCFLSL